MRLHIVPWTLDGLDLGGNLLELGPGYGASTDLLLPQCQTLTCVEYDPRLADNLRERLRTQAPGEVQEQAPEGMRTQVREGLRQQAPDGVRTQAQEGVQEQMPERAPKQAPEEPLERVKEGVQEQGPKEVGNGCHIGLHDGSGGLFGEQVPEGVGKGCHPERSEGPAVSRPATIEASPSERASGERKLTVLHGDAADLQLPASAFDAIVCFMMLHHVIPAPRQDRLFAEAFRILRPGGLFAGADSPAGPLLSLLHLGDKVAMVDPASLPNRLQAAGFEDIQVNPTRYAFRFRARKPAASE